MYNLVCFLRSATTQGEINTSSMSRFEKLINKNTSVCEEQLITTEEYIHKFDAGCILFDRILDRGMFPEQWTQSVVYPLQKDIVLKTRHSQLSTIVIINYTTRSFNL